MVCIWEGLWICADAVDVVGLGLSHSMRVVAAAVTTAAVKKFLTRGEGMDIF